MSKLYLIVLMVVFGVTVHTRHIHPHEHNKVSDVEWKDLTDAVESHEDLTQEIDGMPIEVIIKPTRFVPFNNKVSFASFGPCDDGYKRDVLGICREVW